MRQIDLEYLVIAGLLLSGLYLATTGLIMDLFDSPQFFWHRYAGYAAVALSGLHLAFKWKRVAIYLRFRCGWPTRPERPVQVPPRSLQDRRGFMIAALAGAGGFLLGWFFPGRSLRPIIRPDQAGPPSLAGDLGQLYHHWSKPGLALTSLRNWGRQPARYKTYPGAARLPLPDPHGYRGLSLEEAIEQRRSRRNYRAEPLSLAQLSGLLHAAGGLTDPGREFRAAPSAGALYPIETYLIVHQVSGLAPGLYHYAVAGHTLEQLQSADLRAKTVIAGLGQEMLGRAPVCFVLSAIFQRTRWKYRERAYRYILLEAGHIGQNLYLAATSLGLGACAVGAFLDDQLNDLLGLDGEEEAALYIISVGKV